MKIINVSQATGLLRTRGGDPAVEAWLNIGVKSAPHTRR